MKKNVKKEITNLIDARMNDIQTNFIDGVLNDDGKRIVTTITNQALNLVRRCELDYRDELSECFTYDKKGIPLFSEDKLIEYVSTTIYLKLVEVSKKEKSDFLGISKNDNDSLYNFKRKDTKKFVRYVDSFSEEEGLVPLEITPEQLFQVCSNRYNKVDFESIFLWYINRFDDDVLLEVVKQLFDERFYRIHKENQQFLLDYCQSELKKRANSRIQHRKIEEFIQNKIRFTDSSRAMQMMICKICEIE